MTHTGIVKEIDKKDPQRVKTDTCSRKCMRVLEICQRRLKTKFHNDTESQSEYSICSIIDWLYCIIVKDP